MPRIDFSFQGWIRGATITHCYDPHAHKRVDVSGMTAAELVQKLNKGELTTALGDHLYSNAAAEIEIFDFDGSGS